MTNTLYQTRGGQRILDIARRAPEPVGILLLAGIISSRNAQFLAAKKALARPDVSEFISTTATRAASAIPKDAASRCRMANTLRSELERLRGLPGREPFVYSILHGDNSDLFADVLRVHVPEGSTVADVTFGGGVFWRQVELARYQLLATDLSCGVDARDLPYADGTIDCVVIDPPYMSVPSAAGSAPSGAAACRFRNLGNGPRGPAQVVDLYSAIAREAVRVLKPHGSSSVLVKIQDEFDRRVPRGLLVEVVDECCRTGLSIDDAFVLFARSRPQNRWPGRPQLHARKRHSHFLVFRLPGQRRGSSAAAFEIDRHQARVIAPAPGTVRVAHIGTTGARKVQVCSTLNGLEDSIDFFALAGDAIQVEPGQVVAKGDLLVLRSAGR